MPSMRRTARRSADATCPSPARRRVLTEEFFSIKWPRLALRRRILPVPVTLNRAAAPRSVFIFGIWLILFLFTHWFKRWRRCDDLGGCCRCWWCGSRSRRGCSLHAVRHGLRRLRLARSPVRGKHHHHVSSVKASFGFHFRGAL